MRIPTCFAGAIAPILALSQMLTGVFASTQPAVELVEKERIVQSTTREQGDWMPARLGQLFFEGHSVQTLALSRALLRLSDLTAVRLDSETKISVTQPPGAQAPGIDLTLLKGYAYILNRARQPIPVRTPASMIDDRGTEVAIGVDPSGKTTVTVFEGEVEMHNAQGRLLLRANEQGVAELGRAPRKTAVLEAKNIIQWCLYYPGVVDLPDLQLDRSEETRLKSTLDAYRSGDLLGALDKHPDRLGAGGSPGARVFRAALILAVGQVDQARKILRSLPANHPGGRALEKLIAAVTFAEHTDPVAPTSASEWMAESYYQQSRSNLELALIAARKALELSPDFGFASARVAELEFSFGRTPKARKQVEHSLELAPRNAQAHALQGFLLSAENRLGAARRSFEAAIGLDGALGNAWLGRGLCAIRSGDDTAGRKDLQTAAALEPNRALLRSYLGKAFSQVGNDTKARTELARARELDPDDPTPWLYSAIQNKQENRYNEAVDDLEKSIELNDSRRVYRSQFLLDQDRSVRGTNLAAIYLNNGMTEQSVREAVKAVGGDYASAPAHLFLANSYNALRDPTRILLRYETAWFNELLLSNLLSPVGGGPLSQFVSEQEYSKLFERDGFGISSLTQYFSTGELRETGSQYGTFGNISYALDEDYQFNNGLRPNNEISRFEGYATFKLQATSQDTLFLQTKFEKIDQGNIFQLYDPRVVGRETSTEVRDANNKLRKVVTKNVADLTTDFRETQDPGLILAGWRHEWTTGNHTLLLLGRLANDQVVTADDTRQIILSRDVSRRYPIGLTINRDRPDSDRPLSDGDLRSLLRERAGTGKITDFSNGMFDSDYRSNFETYSAELSQILTLGAKSLILGGRYQRGQFETKVRLDDFNNGIDPMNTDLLFMNPPALQDAVVDFERINLYFYDVWKVTPWLAVTGGVTYDSLKYPENFRTPPVSERQLSLDKVSPKAGFTLTPWWGGTIRGAFSEAISGPSFDESIRLEPTQVNGFLQAYRTVISESEIGSVGGSKYQFWGLSFEQKLPTRTYLGVEYNILNQDLDRTVGIFDALTVPPEIKGIIPSSLNEKDIYREDVITVTANQLLGKNWALGSRYRYTHSKFRQIFAGFTDALDEVQGDALSNLARTADRLRASGLHEVGLYALYNHPSGFFARAEANWFRQDNNNLVTTAVLPAARDPAGTPPRLRTDNLGLPGDNFWQFNVYAGYRFHRNQCEFSIGLLNLTGTDYRLDPLNPYLELPRDQSVILRLKLNF